MFDRVIAISGQENLTGEFMMRSVLTCLFLFTGLSSVANTVLWAGVFEWGRMETPTHREAGETNAARHPMPNFV